MTINHSKNLTDQVNVILKDARFHNMILSIFSIIFNILSIYSSSYKLFLIAIGFLVGGWMVMLLAYLRCITFGQISQLSYMESKDKETGR